MNNSLNISSNNDTSLTVFQKFENKIVDCFEKDNNVWFRLSDIAEVLEVDKATASKWKTWADKDEIELRKTQLGGHPIPYGSESLLYRILNRSNSPKAKPFERWVTKEVIPSIRKNGGYIAGQEQLSEDEIIANALVVAHKILAKREAVIAEMKPKVEFYDKVTGSSDTCDMKEVAKVLNYKNVGRNKLFEILRDEKILDNHNQPYQKYIDAGYFRVIETKFEDKDGDTHINLKTVVFQKGVNFIKKTVDKVQKRG